MVVLVIYCQIYIKPVYIPFYFRYLVKISSMNKAILLCLLSFFSVAAFAQTQAEKDSIKKEKQKKSLIDKANQLGNDLIAGHEKAPDTLVGKFVLDKLTISVPPVWREQGTMLFNDLKLTKTDKLPFVTSLPMPEKKLTQGVTMTMNSIKKSEEDKKQMVITLLKQHLTDYYKQAAQPKSPKEIADVANTMITGPEKFTTNQGKTGDVYLIHEIQAQQASFIVLFVVPGDVPNSIHFVQVLYYKYIYETTFPDDIMDWRTFLYPDDQQTYVDFTKGMFKTLIIR